MDNPNSDTITLLFAGDFVPQDDKRILISDDLNEVLKDKDFSMVNLEVPFTDNLKGILKTGNNHRTSKESAVKVKNCCFDAVSLSNNHIRDYGTKGVADTLDACLKNNILTVGAGLNITDALQPLTVEIKGKRISVLNYSEIEFNAASVSRGGANPFDLIKALEQIKEEKQQNDFVIFVYHGGIEYHYLPTPEIVRLFKFLIDSGVDCIINHHTHRYSGLLFYKKKPLFFGLGNFIAPTKNKNTKQWLTGIMARIIIENENIHGEIIPVQMGKDFLSINLLTGEDRQEVLSHISELSETINNEKLLNDYWIKSYNEYNRKLIQVLDSDSFTEYRLKKLLQINGTSRISRFRLLNTLNFLRCFSQRQKLIKVLEDIYDKYDSEE